MGTASAAPRVGRVRLVRANELDAIYSADPANLGRVSQPTLLKALQEILAGCQQLLAPGGLLVLTARPYRHRDQLVDLPGQLTQVAEAIGLVLYERNAALLVGLREDRLVPRPSFFQLDRVRKGPHPRAPAADHRPRRRPHLPPTDRATSTG